MGLRLLRGRGLEPVAAGEAPRKAVVNQTFASSYFRDEDPVGKPIRLTAPPPADGLLEIAGVVSDLKNQGLREATAPHVYLPGAAAGRTSPVLLVRTRREPLHVLNAVRGEIALVDRQVALRQPGALKDFLGRSFYSEPRFSLLVLALFAVTGTVLVAIGIFSMMAYTVSQQTREIALRMALGASRQQVLGVVLRLGAKLFAAGAVAGLLGSVAASRLIANQLWNTSPHDPATLAAATLVTIAVALAACYVPARRAMAVDPMTALRHE